MTDTKKLELSLAELTHRNSAVTVGRAAWSIVILLSIWQRNTHSGKCRVALPSFLCQSPLVAVLLAGWEPEFCDVDPETGNVSLDEWRRVIDSGVEAVLYVHLFGNVGDAATVAELCKANSVYFIEDIAQAFGGSFDNVPCGAHGDASIVSFGHTKLIDVGSGGAVLINDEALASEIRAFDAHYSTAESDRSVVAKQFLESFYAARRKLTTSIDEAKFSFRGLAHVYEPLVYSKWNPDTAGKIQQDLTNLNYLVEQRRYKYDLYKELIRGTGLKALNMSPGSVPWRAAFRLPGADWVLQEKISEAVRSEGVDISNWYLPSHWLMDNPQLRPGQLDVTERISQEMFQLWLDDGTDEATVKKSASVLVEKLREVGYG
ncbi:DegT/DnrJ/EryC1/StrS family aminotransferase [Pseudomonadota bacterium]